jgi:hypothetical protein
MGLMDDVMDDATREALTAKLAALHLPRRVVEQLEHHEHLNELARIRWSTPRPVAPVIELDGQPFTSTVALDHYRIVGQTFRVNSCSTGGWLPAVAGIAREPRPRGTARQRRLTIQRRMQALRRAYPF